MGRFDLIIFDCDGVLVDSEVITNREFAAMINELGANVTLDDMFDQFVGHSMPYCLALVRDLIGRDVPDHFEADFRERSKRALTAELKAVEGIETALDAITLPMCVASSGDHHKMRTTLGVTGLLHRFEGRLFSGTQVARSKPAPDVFLFAAEQMGFPPERTVVVEDTPVGVTAAKAAGMTVLGYAGRTPEVRLQGAGASQVFRSMHELPALIAALG